MAHLQVPASCQWKINPNEHPHTWYTALKVHYNLIGDAGLNHYNQTIDLPLDTFSRKTGILNPILYFIRDIRKTGAVAPSSKYLCSDMVRFLAEKVQTSARPLRILELGPGTGTLTKAILNVIRKTDTLDLVEINPHFCRMLRREFRHPKLQVHFTDLLEFSPEQPYDYIFSSIPYESIPEEISKAMWQQKLRLCKPGGLISYYKYVNFNHFRCKFEKELVAAYSIDRSFVLRNFPPAQLFTLKITRDAASETIPEPVKLARRKKGKPRFMLTA